jgi:hypothetical protein
MNVDDILNALAAREPNGRETRRATIWTRNGAGWQILYHQGTLIAAA